MTTSQRSTEPQSVAYTRDEGDRPASVREIVALRRELAALQDRVESLTGLIARHLGLRLKQPFDHSR